MNFNMNRNKNTHCFSCRRELDLNMLNIKLDSGFILCEQCVNGLTEIMQDTKKKPSLEKAKKLTEDLIFIPANQRHEERTPREIKAILDDSVIGQDEAKKSLAVAIYNHYKRLYATPMNEDIELQKSNILMMGPTGSGKTLLAKTIARTLDVPIYIADATTLTEAGYVGDDVENILLGLIEAADGDIERAEHGIIYIDEVDKLAKKEAGTSITRDVSGEGVQQALLKIIEGTVASVPKGGGRKHPQAEHLKINTSEILFICSGAFDGIDKIIESRTDRKNHVLGFAKTVEDDDMNYDEGVQIEDFVKFGLIPEFLGRLPVVVALDKLTEDDLVHILTGVKNSIVGQYTELLARDGIELVFEKEALREIAAMSIKKNTGARGLRSIIEKLMKNVMFEAPSDPTIMKVIVTKESVKTGKLECEKIAA